MIVLLEALKPVTESSFRIGFSVWTASKSPLPRIAPR